MFNRTKTPNRLDQEIDRALTQLSNLNVDSEEYEKLLERVTKLHKMKAESKPSGVSPDTALLAATNLAGILMIINYERIHVISTKALGFVGRTR
jgi:hypothetical protein